MRKFLCFLFHYLRYYRIISVGSGQASSFVFYCLKCKKYRTLCERGVEP